MKVIPETRIPTKFDNHVFITTCITTGGLLSVR